MKPLIKEKKSPRGLVPSSSFGRLDVAYNQFLGDVDPRNNDYAQYALAAATDIRYREFLRLIGEQRYRTWSLAAIAKVCDLSLPEFGDFWRKAQLQRGMTAAINAIPTLTQDLIGDAASQQLVCERCDGFGTVLRDGEDEEDDAERKGRGTAKQKIRTCPNCKGIGTVRKAGDSHARDKLLEMTGLGKKGGGGAAVVINQNFGGMGIESATDRLDKISFTFDAEAEDISNSDNSDEA